MPVAGSEFNDPVLLQNGKLRVTGPYRPGIDNDDQLVGDVVIRYLIFKEQDEKQTVAAQGTATWKLRRKPGKQDFVDWEDVTDAGGLVPGDRVRAVGVAIQATKYDKNPQVPPSVMSYNWCVTREVKAEAAGAETADALESALAVGAGGQAE
jgi:hypothetical protein